VCSLNRDNFQSFSNSATSIGLDIPIAKGIIGLDVSHEQNAGEFQSRLNLFCSSQYATYDRKDFFKVSTASVSHDLADTLKFCIQNQREALLNIKGAFVTIAPQGGLRNFVANLQLKSPAQAVAVKITTIAPEGQVSCVYKGNVVKPDTLLDGFNESLSCTKDPMAAINLVISTNLGTTEPVSVPAETGRIDELNEDIIALTTRLTAIEETGKSEVARLDGLVKGVVGTSDERWGALSGFGKEQDATSTVAVWQGNGGETGFVKCPSGSYVMGVSIIDQDTGGYCASCINAVRVLCSTLGGH
jgi:hypothetical protein